VTEKFTSSESDIDAIKTLGADRLAQLLGDTLPADHLIISLRGRKLADALADGWRHEVAPVLQQKIQDALRAVRAVGTAKIATTAKSGKGVAIMRRVAGVFPDDWVQAGNKAPVRVVVSSDRGHYATKWDRAKGAYIRELKTDDSSTAEHEYAHHLQSLIPSLDKVFQAEHKRRTAGDSLEVLCPHLPNETGRPDGYYSRYQGREYAATDGALEVMTMALQPVLGRDRQAQKMLADMLGQDPKMLELTLGLLFHFKP
jgi:hypothetical protein